MRRTRLVFDTKGNSETVLEVAAEKATGKSRCGVCGKMIEEGDRCTRISMNSRASRCFHVECLEDIAARTRDVAE